MNILGPRIAAIRHAHQDQPDRMTAPLNALKQDYLEGALRRGGAGTKWVTDKSLDLTDQLPILLDLFPNAAFIELDRDVRDVALSCYQTGFTFENDFTNSFDDFFVYVDRRQELLDTTDWSHRNHVKLRYEDLVVNQQTETEALLSDLGLGADPSCLRPEETTASVRTESYWQARQPVHGNSVGRWRRYATQLRAQHARFSD